MLYTERMEALSKIVSVLIEFFLRYIKTRFHVSGPGCDIYYMMAIQKAFTAVREWEHSWFSAFNLREMLRRARQKGKRPRSFGFSHSPTNGIAKGHLISGAIYPVLLLWGVLLPIPPFSRDDIAHAP